MFQDDDPDQAISIESPDSMQGLPKVDIEERIKSATLEDLQEIVDLISQVESSAKRAVLIEKISKKVGASRKIIAQQVELAMQDNSTWSNATAEEYRSEDAERRICAVFDDLVDIAEDDEKKVVYILRSKNFLTNIDQLSIATEWDLNGEILVPPHIKHVPFLLPRAGNVMLHYAGQNDKQLFMDVFNFLQRFACLPNNTWLLPTTFIFLSYIQDFDDVHYFPELVFFAEPARGKSRTGKAIAHIAFRGVHLITVREAAILRLCRNLRCTLFFDVRNIWGQVKRANVEDVFLGRFEKGASVPRVLFPEKGAFADTSYFDVFGPTIIATNEPIQYILDTRCLPITMPNKPGNYENPQPSSGLELKERLVAWRARMMMNNVTLPIVNTIEGINGRLWDITKPLFQVCQLICPDAYEFLKREILNIAREKIQDAKETIQWEIIKSLYELSPDAQQNWITPMEDLVKALNQNKKDEHKLTSQAVGKKVKALGLKASHKRGHSFILLSQNELQLLMNQYGILPLEKSSQEVQPTLPDLDKLVDDILDNLE